MIRPAALFLLCLACQPFANALADDHQSVARQWNEVLLYAIRNDFARPTVHARNLFHASAAMYDAWAIYHPPASPYFLGQTQANGFSCPYSDAQRTALVDASSDETERQSSVEIAISTAMHRLLSHRFATSPGTGRIQIRINALLDELNLPVQSEPAATSSTTSSPTSSAAQAEIARELGDTIAQCIIDFGMSDGANEPDLYSNRYYQPYNDPLRPATPGNPSIANPDRWQPLLLNSFVDQSGNPVGMPEFLGAEWGNVEHFALKQQDSKVLRRNGDSYRIYLDPGAPVLFASDAAGYARGHSLVAVWSSHLDPTDGVQWDISPASIGASPQLPATNEDLTDFYQYLSGGTQESGHDINPVTGTPYSSNLTLRGDYTRVVAEYWADGPDSETPPGHWFTILNQYVLDHPQFERRYGGTGEVLSELEFDIRSYFLLGGAMHDAAIAAWSIKGWYDYVRPVSALRYLAELGQSSDSSLPNYNARGIPLVDGIIGVVTSNDELAGSNEEHVGKIKVRAWRGPDFINNPQTDRAGVGWILLQNWWPYQRPTFVTPPFAGYVSGHSTFSRAAAEVLTSITGSEFFPGGLAEFTARANEFLVFEEGPSQDVTLQWATYVDASDQSSLSRIWGGIHPPIDDIPGRRVGMQVAERAVERAESFFYGNPEPRSIKRSNGSGCVLTTDPDNLSNDVTFLLLLLVGAASIKPRRSRCITKNT